MSQEQQTSNEPQKPQQQGHRIGMYLGVIGLWTGMAFAMLYPSVEGFAGWQRLLPLRIGALSGAAAMVIWLVAGWRHRRAGVRPADGTK